MQPKFRSHQGGKSSTTLQPPVASTRVAPFPAAFAACHPESRGLLVGPVKDTFQSCRQAQNAAPVGEARALGDGPARTARAMLPPARNQTDAVDQA